MTRSEQATLLRMDLEEREVCTGSLSERTANLAVNLHDDTLLDAAIWRGAQALFMFMDHRGAELRLATQPASVRQLYLTLAIHCWASLRLTLEGGLRPHEVAELYAYFQNHKSQLGAQVAARRARASMHAVEPGA